MGALLDVGGVPTTLELSFDPKRGDRRGTWGGRPSLMADISNPVRETLGTIEGKSRRSRLD